MKKADLPLFAVDRRLAGSRIARLFAKLVPLAFPLGRLSFFVLVIPVLAGCVFAADTSLARWTPLADPYADNPFPVPHVRTPTDAKTRWAGFESRIGTNLPTDYYHWWRHDVTNRAEMQDIWWREEMVAANVPMDWNGDFDKWIPGRTTQAWRNAELRLLNLHRYNYVQQVPTQGMNFLKEDLSLLPTVMAGAITLANGGPKSYSHNLLWNYPERRPAGCPDDIWSLAVWGVGYSNIGFSGFTAYDTVASYIIDAGNSDSGHRVNLFAPDATIATIGDVGMNWSPSDFLLKRDAEGKYDAMNVSYINTNEVEGTMERNGPTVNPFRNASVWPYAGYVPIELNPYVGVPISISLPSNGLYLGGTSNNGGWDDGFDLSNVKMTVKVNGVPVGTRNLNIYLWGHRTIVSFQAEINDIVGQNDFHREGVCSDHYTYLGLDEDVEFEVTVEGLRYLKNFRTCPNLANKQFDPTLFEPNTVSWKFTVFDPFRVRASSYKSKSPVSNLSTRAGIGQGDRVLIAGLTVTGEEPLKVCLRAQGPGLKKYGITNAAQNPQIDVYQVLADGQNRVLGGNDDWKSGANWRLIQSYGLNPSEDGESAVVATLMPGLYTAVVRDAGTGGVGIVEAFAIDNQSTSKLTNVSTRAYVGTGEEAMIAGFSLQEVSTVVVRAQGPSLTAYGVAGAVADPVLKIVRQSDGTVIDQNDDWEVAANARLKTDLSGYRPGHAKDAARIITLPAGNYTVLVEGKDGTGVGLVEVFRVD